MERLQFVTVSTLASSFSLLLNHGQSLKVTKGSFFDAYHRSRVYDSGRFVLGHFGTSGKGWKNAITRHHSDCADWPILDAQTAPSR